HPRTSPTQLFISLPTTPPGSPGLSSTSLAGRSWSRRPAARSAASSVNGEHFLCFAHAPQRVPTHRQQWLSHSLRGLHERGNQYWLPQHFAQSLEARCFIHGGADDREVEAVGGAYFSGRDFPPGARGVQ